MQFIIDKGTGYKYCYAPKHPCSNKVGKLMEHVYVMYKHLGRELEGDECVHHIDRDRTNNILSNLTLMTLKEHAKLHALEDKGVVYETRYCLKCSASFETTKAVNKKFCSASCAALYSRNFEVSREELEDLVWKYPTTQVASWLGVSDSAVGKRCKLLGITKPPRGYWRRVETGTLCSA